MLNALSNSTRTLRVVQGNWLWPWHRSVETMCRGAPLAVTLMADRASSKHSVGGSQGIHTNLTPPSWRYVALGVRSGSVVMSAVSYSYSAYKQVERILIILRDELLTL